MPPLEPPPHLSTPLPQDFASPSLGAIGGNEIRYVLWEDNVVHHPSLSLLLGHVQDPN